MSSLLPISSSSYVNRFFTFVIPYLNSSKTKITGALALGAFVVLAGTHYFARRRQYAISMESLDVCIKQMLPQGESIQKKEEVKGGFLNNIWRIHTEKKSYIVRLRKKKMQSSEFVQILEISKHAFKCGIAPQIFGEDRNNQCILLEYIERKPWPSYKENPEPYLTTMKALKCFHENIESNFSKNKKISYSPFAFIFYNKDLGKLPNTPMHFSRALKIIENIYERLKPWLTNHATFCHSDFHRGNVLLSKTRILLIDFDSASIGDPIFDVVKFSQGLRKEYRLEMLSEYLGTSRPTKQEYAHFELMDLALLMEVFIIRFKLAQNTQGSSQEERLTKEEMEKILDSEEPLPSFLSMPFSDTSPKARQKGAIFALGELLRRSGTASFNEDLENFNI